MLLGLLDLALQLAHLGLEVGLQLSLALCLARAQTSSSGTPALVGGLRLLVPLSFGFVILGRKVGKP